MISDQKNSRLNLVEFQKKIFARLDQAKNQKLEKKLLKIRCNDEFYLLDFEQIEGVFSCKPVASIVYTQSWFLGLVNLKGLIYNVVDLPVYIDFLINKKKNVKNSSIKNNGYFVSLNKKFNNQVVVYVDEFFGVGLVKELKKLDEDVDLEDRYIDTVDKIWKKIDLEMLITNQKFLNINI